MGLGEPNTNDDAGRPGWVSPDATPEEQLAAAEAHVALLRKKLATPTVSRNCSVCNAFLMGGGICPRCKDQSAKCPLCGDGRSTMVCRACINAGAPYCDLCLSPMHENEERPCRECRKGTRAADFPINDAPVSPPNILDGAHVYEPAAIGATMPAPSYEIPQ